METEQRERERRLRREGAGSKRVRGEEGGGGVWPSGSLGVSCVNLFFLFFYLSLWAGGSGQVGVPTPFQNTNPVD